MINNNNNGRVVYAQQPFVLKWELAHNKLAIVQNGGNQYLLEFGLKATNKPIYAFCEQSKI